MSDTAVWNNTITAPRTETQPDRSGRTTLLAAVLLAVGLGVASWLYFEETRVISLVGGQAASETLTKQFNHWALWVAVGTAGGASAFLLVLLTGLSRWQKGITSQVREKEEEWERTLGAVQGQVAEARRGREAELVLRNEAEDRVRQLEGITQNLQQELDRRNRAEKALTQKRRELESSKSVLEMHVQARTEQLQTLQRRHEMILNAAGEGICGLDLEGRTSLVNPTVAKLTGWAVDELIGRPEREIFIGNPNGPGEDGTAQAQNAGEQMVRRKDGSCFPVEFVKTTITENGRDVGSVLVFKDITVRKQVENTLAQKAAELARSNAELEQFAFVASHDLQEPLRKIQAFGDRLKARCEEVQSPDARDYLERMQNAAARMRTLINDLLAFSRVIRSSEPFVAVDLAAITKEALSDLEVRIEKSGGRVEVGELPTIEADPMQMRQLLLNLIGNALKFQPPGNQPVVRIAGRTFNNAAGEAICELSVRDNGIGFDEKYLDKIFAVFQRLHGRGEYEGTGVGLAVCRRIVDRHHGNIVARSKPGEGATFTVTLPARQPKETPRA